MTTDEIRKQEGTLMTEQKPSKRKTVDAKVKLAAMELAKQGYTLRRICKMLDNKISPATCSKYIRASKRWN